MFNLLALSDVSQNLVSSLTNSLGFWYLIILNGFGVIAMILKVIEYQLKSRNMALVLAVIGTTCWLFYFAFQGDFTSAIVTIIGVLQFLVFFQRGKHAWANSIWWLFLSLSLQIVTGLITFAVWHDAFALLAGLFGSAAYFMISKKKYRAMSFFYAGFWVANSVLKWYIIALLNDAFAFISVSIAIIRFDVIPKIKERKNKKASEKIASEQLQNQTQIKE